MDIKSGQKWHYQFDGRKLRFRQISRSRKAGAPKVGAWRKVGKDIWYTVEEGKSSGLPQNLFHPLQEVILAPVMKITLDKRTFRRALKPLYLGLSDGAALLGCDMAQESNTLIRFLRRHKPSMEFLIVDFHRHSPEEFFQKDSQGNPIKNRRGLPRRALGKLAHELRKRKRTGVRHLEHESKAILRWMIVVFAPSVFVPRNVWLVPARSSRGEN